MHDARLDRYFRWGSELRPWPGELEYLRTVRQGPYYVAPAQPWDGRTSIKNTRGTPHEPAQSFPDHRAMDPRGHLDEHQRSVQDMRVGGDNL